MFYYEVWPRSNRYHGSTALTYQSETKISIGELVLVPLQTQTVTALVIQRVAKPSFKCKPITSQLNLPTLPKQLVDLGRWLQAYYPSPLGIVAQQLTPSLTSRTSKTDFKPLGKTSKSAPLAPLTNQQTLAVNLIDQPDTYLLHGITGSGKTRLYIELAKKQLKANKSVLILTPEISLTSQLANRFQAAFQDQVVVMHSHQTPAERRAVWLSLAQANQPAVVIGPRSILFSPLQDIGLIVLDEAHEPAYKQEQAPHYNASRVAAKLRQLHNAILVLGSATPLVSDYYEAEVRNKPIIRLDELAVKSDYGIKTQLIDLKDRTLFPKSSYLSQPLISAIKQAINDGQQTLLYLNRRGTARLIICESCGWQAMCPHCDIPLTYHDDSHKLRCHVCDWQGSPPVTCPDCNQASIVYKSIGTKAVVNEVQKLFPEARIQRFDTDNTKSERFEKHYQNIVNGDVDIIIGTQILAKGLDLPKLSVLGILMADTSLQMPDYTASERTYQLLNQVLGRIGRGHLDGQAFIQTYQPNNFVVQAAINDDFQAFYRSEIKERRQFKLPPFYYILKLNVRRASPKAAAKAAEQFAEKIASQDLIIDGPAPSMYEKVAGKYQYQLVIKSSRRSALLEVISQLPANWSYDIDPANLL